MCALMSFAKKAKVTQKGYLLLSSMVAELVAPSGVREAAVLLVGRRLGRRPAASLSSAASEQSWPRWPLWLARCSLSGPAFAKRDRASGHPEVPASPPAGHHRRLWLERGMVGHQGPKGGTETNTNHTAGAQPLARPGPRLVQQWKA